MAKKDVGVCSQPIRVFIDPFEGFAPPFLGLSRVQQAINPKHQQAEYSPAGVKNRHGQKMCLSRWRALF